MSLTHTFEHSNIHRFITNSVQYHSHSSCSPINNNTSLEEKNFQEKLKTTYEQKNDN